MEVGDIVEKKVGDERNKTFLISRKYEVLKIYPKKSQQQDMILCRDLKNGCKECFQRFDLTEFKHVPKKMEDHTELKNKIRNLLESGLSRGEVIDKLIVDGIGMNRQKLRYWVASVDLNLGHKIPPRSKKVEQLDGDGNVIRTFNSIVEAADALDYSYGNVRDMCIGRIQKPKYNLRFAEVQDDKQ